MWGGSWATVKPEEVFDAGMAHTPHVRYNRAFEALRTQETIEHSLCVVCELRRHFLLPDRLARHPAGLAVDGLSMGLPEMVGAGHEVVGKRPSPGWNQSSSPVPAFPSAQYRACSSQCGISR